MALKHFDIGFGKSDQSLAKQGFQLQEGDIYMQRHLAEGTATVKATGGDSKISLQGDVVDQLAANMSDKVLASSTPNAYIRVNKNGNTAIFTAKIVEVKNGTISLSDVVNFQKDTASLANNDTAEVRILSPGDYAYGSYIGYTKNIAFEMADESSEFMKNNEVIRKDFKKRDFKVSFDIPNMSAKWVQMMAFKSDTATVNQASHGGEDKEVEVVSISGRPNDALANQRVRVVAVYKDTEGVKNCYVLNSCSIQTTGIMKELEDYKGAGFDCTALRDGFFPETMSMGYVLTD